MFPSNHSEAFVDARERCGNIVSMSGDMLGDDDFFFEWFENPSQAEINDLIRKIVRIWPRSDANTP